MYVTVLTSVFLKATTSSDCMPSDTFLCIRHLSTVENGTGNAFRQVGIGELYGFKHVYIVLLDVHREPKGLELKLARMMYCLCAYVRSLTHSHTHTMRLISCPTSSPPRPTEFLWRPASRTSAKPPPGSCALLHEPSAEL